MQIRQMVSADFDAAIDRDPLESASSLQASRREGQGTTALTAEKGAPTGIIFLVAEQQRGEGVPDQPILYVIKRRTLALYGGCVATASVP